MVIISIEMEEWLQIIFKFLISFMVPLLRDGLSRTCNVTGYILSQHNQGTFTPPVIPSPPPPIPLGKRNKTDNTYQQIQCFRSSLFRLNRLAH